MATLAAGLLAASASATAPIFSPALVFKTQNEPPSNFFAGPRGLAFDSSGNLWITDDHDRVEKFTSKGEFISQFGESGTGNGQFDRPVGIAIDSSGNLWVVDSDNDRVQKFNSEGKYISQFGGHAELAHLEEKGEGAKANGKFWGPEGIAIDSSGNLYVVDYYNHRVQKFNSKGEYLNQFGSKGYPAEGKGQFAFPSDVAIDSYDNVWVTDSDNNRIEAFSPEGGYLSQFSTEEGIYSSFPEGIAIFQGNIWVVESDQSRVREYSPEGKLLNGFGEEGHEEGQFYIPNGIAVPSAGEVWVADMANHRVQKWTTPPKVTTTEATANEAKLSGTVNPQGVETTYRFEYGKTTSYGTSVPVPDKSVGSGTSDVNVSQTVEGLEGNTTYHFRIVATNSYGTTNGADKSFTTPEWMTQTTPEPSEVEISALRAASCTSSEACVAVGEYTPKTGYQRALTKVKSGGKWSLTSSPNPTGSVGAFLSDVSCSASNSCTAIGSYSTSSQNFTLAERWNGSEWSLQSMPTMPSETVYKLESIACPASNDCTAVGYSETELGNKVVPLAEHWNGTTWTVSSIANPEKATRAWIYGISCVSTSDCWAVGYRNKTGNALAEHWNGSTWTVNSPAELNKELTDISCGSSSSCVALAIDGTLARWNGSTWSKETAPKPEGAASEALQGVSCYSASACVIVGWYNTPANPVAIGWNGSKWSIQTASFPVGVEAAYFNDTSCTSATGCTAVGTSYQPLRTLVEVRK